MILPGRKAVRSIHVCLYCTGCTLCLVSHNPAVDVPVLYAGGGDGGREGRSGRRKNPARLNDTDDTVLITVFLGTGTLMGATCRQPPSQLARDIGLSRRKPKRGVGSSGYLSLCARFARLSVAKDRVCN